MTGDETNADRRSEVERIVRDALADEAHRQAQEIPTDAHDQEEPF